MYFSLFCLHYWPRCRHFRGYLTEKYWLMVLKDHQIHPKEYWTLPLEIVENWMYTVVYTVQFVALKRRMSTWNILTEYWLVCIHQFSASSCQNMRLGSLKQSYMHIKWVHRAVIISKTHCSYEKVIFSGSRKEILRLIVASNHFPIFSNYYDNNGAIVRKSKKLKGFLRSTQKLIIKGWSSGRERSKKFLGIH